LFQAEELRRAKDNDAVELDGHSYIEVIASSDEGHSQVSTEVIGGV